MIDGVSVRYIAPAVVSRFGLRVPGVHATGRELARDALAAYRKGRAQPTTH